jgi:hypothetical protein
MCWDPQQSREAWQGSAGDSEDGTGKPISFHLTQDPIPTRDLSTCISSGNPNNGQVTIGVCNHNERVSSTLTASYGTKWNGNSGAFNGDNFAFENANK